MTRLRIALLAALLLAPGTGAALAQTGAAPAAPVAAEPVIGPHPNPTHPIGGYLKGPAGSIRLIDKVFEPADGLPLYVLNRDCKGQCAVLFPPLTPGSDAKAPSKSWTIIVREENGDRQWVYKGKPVYTFVDDKKDVHPQADGVLPEIKLARP